MQSYVTFNTDRTCVCPLTLENSAIQLSNHEKVLKMPECPGKQPFICKLFQEAEITVLFRDDVKLRLQLCFVTFLTPWCDKSC